MEGVFSGTFPAGADTPGANISPATARTNGIQRKKWSTTPASTPFYFLNLAVEPKMADAPASRGNPASTRNPLRGIATRQLERDPKGCERNRRRHGTDQRPRWFCGTWVYHLRARFHGGTIRCCLSTSLRRRRHRSNKQCGLCPKTSCPPMGSTLPTSEQTG